MVRRLLYISQMNHGQIAWEATRLDRVWELLNDLKPKPDEEDLRGFEWHYWQRLSNF